MLADGVAVVGGVDDVGVVQDAVGGEFRHEGVDEFVDGLQRAQALAVEVVVEGDVGGVLLGEGADPVGAAGLC